MEAPAVRYPAVERLLAGPQFVWVVVGIDALLGLARSATGCWLTTSYPRVSHGAALSKGDAPWWDMFVLVEHDPRRTIGLRTSGRCPDGPTPICASPSSGRSR
jgi:hypothetical protein